MASMATAATVTVDFDSGSSAGSTYVEDGFTFTSNIGTAGTSNDCGSACLQFGNNEIITVTYSGGTFSVLGFDFRVPGNPGDLSANGTFVPENAGITGNDMSTETFTTEFLNLTSFTFQNVNNGSGRVDNIVFDVAAVPVPAAGFLMLGGLGALALRRRCKDKTA